MSILQGAYYLSNEARHEKGESQHEVVRMKLDGSFPAFFTTQFMAAPFLHSFLANARWDHIPIRLNEVSE